MAKHIKIMQHKLTILSSRDVIVSQILMITKRIETDLIIQFSYLIGIEKYWKRTVQLMEYLLSLVCSL